MHFTDGITRVFNCIILLIKKRPQIVCIWYYCNGETIASSLV